MKPFTVLAACALLTACQADPLSGSPVPAKALSAQQRQGVKQAVLATHAAVPALEKPVSQGTVAVKGQQLTLSLELYPKANAGFATQLLDLTSANKLYATVTDSRGKSYTATLADGDGAVAYTGGTISLTFENVLPDPLLIVEVQAKNGTTVIPQANLATALRHTSTSSPVNASINFQTTVAAKALKAMLPAQAARARTLDLAALNNLTQLITGQTGSSPPYSYPGSHPSLVNTALLSTELVNLGTNDPTALNARAADFRQVGATLDLTIAGLNNGDQIQVQVTDAASAVKTGLVTGNTQSITGITPGSALQVIVKPFGSAVDTYVYAPISPLTLAEGSTTPLTITAAAIANITSLTPASGKAGDEVTINGAGFGGSPVVKFNGSSNATITANTGTQLKVLIPADATDGKITVTNGTTATSATDFDVIRRIYVNDDATGGANNGSSWANAYTSLQTALAAAGVQDQIWVAAGSYKPVTPAAATPTDAERNIAFQLKANVNIYGGFAGTESNLSDRTPSLTDFVTVLSGDIDNNDVYTPTLSGITHNSKTVVLGANNTTLEGVTIKGGNASNQSGNGPGVFGGGMYNFNSSPELTNVSFASNYAELGGGMYNEASSPTLTNVSFAANSGYAGGGMYNFNSSPELTNVIFTSNSGSVGGGMSNVSSSPTLSNVSFASNSAPSGGGMFNNSVSFPILKNVLLWKSTLFGQTITNGTDGNFDLGSLAADDPFVDSANPTNNGLKIKASATSIINMGIGPAGSNGIPLLDILGLPRVGNAEPGAYEYIPLPANVILVNQNATGNNDGSSWDNAYTDLQSALGAATAGNEIWVAAGSYKPVTPAASTPTDAERNIAFQLKADVNIYGGFKGFESNLSDRTASLTDFVTVLSGDIDNNDVYTPTVSGITNNSKTVVLGANNTTLEGVTIKGGNASDDTSGAEQGYAGGGMYNASSSPTLSNVSFVSNSASNLGGGMFNTSSSSPTLSNVSFISNSASNGGGGGGGMFNISSSSPTLSNVSFVSNSAANGGGMYNSGSSPTLSNVSFASNSSVNGGGIFNGSSSLTLSNVSFTSNSASSFGGGMCNYSSSLTLSNVSFASNSASSRGGGMYLNSSSSSTLSNVSFASNSASSFGGGIRNEGPSLVLKNVLLWNSTLSGQTITNGTNGNFDLGSLPADDPFVASADPNNDLNIKASATSIIDQGIGPAGSNGIPLLDILGLGRIGSNPEPGAYEYRP